MVEADQQSPEDPLVAFEARIGHIFSDRKWLIQSLTHPSFLQTSSGEGRHNQRLEFLGDAILSAVLAETLFVQQPDAREGDLSRIRALLARGEQLSKIARELQIGDVIRIGTAEENNGGRDRDSILEDALEALVGAIFLDAGWMVARAAVLKWYGDIDDRINARLAAENPKGQLQELVQAMPGSAPVQYRLVDVSGPDHERRFWVEVVIDNQSRGIGEGSSKKEAEERAARQALSQWADNAPNQEC